MLDDAITKLVLETSEDGLKKIYSCAAKKMPAEMLMYLCNHTYLLDDYTDDVLRMLADSSYLPGVVYGMLEKYGDDFYRVYQRYGDDAIEVLSKYGDELFGLPESYRHEAIDLVMSYGDEVLEGIRKYGDDFMIRYANEGETFIQEYLEKGDEVFENATKPDAGSGSEGGSQIKLTEPTLPKGGIPKGSYEPERPGPDGIPIIRQNESANLLAEQGYDIEMLPEKVGGNGYGIKPNSNPDYLIDGEAFDCFAPDGARARNAWTTVKEKTETQAERIILNLADYKGSIDELYNQFMEWDIETLKELIVIKDGTITRWLPK